MKKMMTIFPLQTSPMERIDALELLGATFVDKKRDLLGALKYWKRAMDLRYMDSNNVVHKSEPKQLIMAYDYAREVSISLRLYSHQTPHQCDSTLHLLLLNYVLLLLMLSPFGKGSTDFSDGTAFKFTLVSGIVDRQHIFAFEEKGIKRTRHFV